MPHPDYSSFSVSSDVQEEFRKIMLQKRIVKFADNNSYDAETVDSAIDSGEIRSDLNEQEQERLKQIIWAKAEINGAKWKLNTRKLGADAGATLTDFGIASDDMEAFTADILAFIDEYGTEGQYDAGTASDEATKELSKLLSIDGKPIGYLETYDGSVVCVGSDSIEFTSRTAPHYSACWAADENSILDISLKFPGAEAKTIEYGVEDFDISEEEFPNLRDKIFAMSQPTGRELRLANANNSAFAPFNTTDSGSQTYTYTTLDGEVDATGYGIIWYPTDQNTYQLFIPDATSLADMRGIGFPEDKVAIMTITAIMA